MSHWPALVNVVDSQCAHAEDEEYGYEHVVDGPDMVDLKQFTGEEEATQRNWKKHSHDTHKPWENMRLSEWCLCLYNFLQSYALTRKVYKVVYSSLIYNLTLVKELYKINLNYNKNKT